MPQQNNEPTPEARKREGKSGMFEAIKKRATKVVQMGALLGALASAEVAEGQSVSRGPTYSTPSKPKAERVVTTTSSGTRTSESASRSVTARTPTYSARGTITSHGERVTGLGVARVHGKINLPKTGFQKKVEAYNGGQIYPSLSHGFRSGTVSKRISIDLNLRNNTQFNSGLTRPKPRKK